MTATSQAAFVASASLVVRLNVCSTCRWTTARSPISRSYAFRSSTLLSVVRTSVCSSRMSTMDRKPMISHAPSGSDGRQ